MLLFGVTKLFEELFLTLAEILRGFDNHGDDVRAAVAIATHQRNAMPGELEWRAGLSAGRDLHTHVAIDGLNIDRGAEGGINHGNDFFGKNNAAFAGEMFVWLDTDKNVEVALCATLGSGAAFAVQADRHTIVDAGRNLNFEIFAVSANDLGGAKNSFVEGQSHCGAIVGAAGGAAGAATKAENRTQNIIEAPAAPEVKVKPLAIKVELAVLERVSARGASIATNASVTKLIIARPLLFIRQNFVRLRNFFELFLRSLIARIFVRMILHRQLAVSFLDFIIGSVFGHSQNFIIISFCHNLLFRYHYFSTVCLRVPEQYAIIIIMKAIQLPKLSSAGKIAICIGLILVSLSLWLGAALVGLMLFTMMPAIRNTLEYAPMEAIIFSLNYALTALTYIVLGCLVIKLTTRLKNGGQLKGSYVVAVGVTLGLLVVYRLLLELVMIARL